MATYQAHLTKAGSRRSCPGPVEATMSSMQDSMAQPLEGAGLGGDLANVPAWKALLSVSAAVLLAIVFVAAGTWKITDPFGAAVRLTQAQVPHLIGLPGAIALGTLEAFCGVLLLVPRFRRWGALLAGALLAFFMTWIAAYYNVLRGEECNCFPLIKRAVGPGFFIVDTGMLALAALAWFWSRPSQGKRSAAVILGAVAVFAGVSYGVNAARLTGIKAPPTIAVDGKPFSLEHGHIFLYFYDPECMHCDAAARRMSRYNWRDTRIVAIPTRVPRFAAAFLRDTGLRAATATEVDRLRKVFLFVDPPYGVALEYGAQKQAFTQFDDDEPRTSLRKLGYVE